MSEILQQQQAVFPVTQEELKPLKNKMLNWARQFSIFLFLDSNGYTAQGGRYDCLLGAGARDVFSPVTNSFDELYAFHQAQRSWLFGHLGYDLKNELEPRLSSAHKRRHDFSEMQFFVPEVVAGIDHEAATLFIEATDPGAIYRQIMAAPATDATSVPELDFQQRINREQYLRIIAALREHIRNGDCYEINFCNEAFCEDAVLDAVATFQRLNQLSPAPFAACYRLDTQYLLCASPERYLRKSERQIISQPIKGTARRGIDTDQDEQLKQDLLASEKERAENVMIVDLVRNDLARSCETGSVQVDELFGLYSFPQVHQLISTVSGMLRKDLTFTNALKHSFPMGSMTGAPKVKVMQLIEQYEAARRELFAGSVGYIDPRGDFDFNVVIRSLFYNETSQYLSYQTGGAITWDSDAAAEWEEMRLKAMSMERVFKA